VPQSTYSAVKGQLVNGGFNVVDYPLSVINQDRVMVVSGQTCLSLTTSPAYSLNF
jgi:hypothetical protein